ncbi:MAG: disulfide bond formation protein B [Betaproteobacteria bacterium]|nr:MAG: disulfide bond formation protein B [Betaproteobacteria bacterium]
MIKSISARQILGAAAVVSLAAVGFALWTQYALGMNPCPWCILQRVICIAIALAALPGALLKQRAAQIVSALFVAALALAGAAAAAWQHFVAAASPSCDLTLADRIVAGLGLEAALPQVFSPQASCADAAVRLLGISYDFWTLALFILLGASAAAALWSRPDRA